MHYWPVIFNNSAFLFRSPWHNIGVYSRMMLVTWSSRRPSPSTALSRWLCSPIIASMWLQASRLAVSSWASSKSRCHPLRTVATMPPQVDSLCACIEAAIRSATLIHPQALDTTTRSLTTRTQPCLSPRVSPTKWGSSQSSHHLPLWAITLSTPSTRPPTATGPHLTPTTKLTDTWGITRPTGPWADGLQNLLKVSDFTGIFSTFNLKWSQLDHQRADNNASKFCVLLQAQRRIWQPPCESNHKFMEWKMWWLRQTHI